MPTSSRPSNGGSESDHRARLCDLAEASTFPAHVRMRTGGAREGGEQRGEVAQTVSGLGFGPSAVRTDQSTG